MNGMRELYQEVILDHNRNPRNCHKMQGASCHADGFNPLCGDKLSLYLQIDNNVISDVSFVGCGCAISTASASLMTESLKGKTVKEADMLFSQFHKMLTENDLSVEKAIGKLAVLAGVKEFPARVKCATLAWHTLQAALGNNDTVATTE